MAIARFRNQGGFLNLPNDHIVKIIGVALCLCLVCSVLVSTAATLLKPAQVANKLLDKKRNIVAVSGLGGDDVDVDQAFAEIEARVVDLRSGEYSDAVDATQYDQLRASKDPAMSIKLEQDQDIARVGRRAHYANVYLVRDGEQLKRIVLPIKGYGLWSTMFGFVALESDLKTVAGITFYEHEETPGLGGEIANPRWQQSWVGKQVVNPQGETVLHLVKGSVNPGSSDAQYQIDGLAGATLTSNGVTNLIQFWLGDNGFGPFLNRLRQQVTGIEPGATTESVMPRRVAQGG